MAGIELKIRMIDDLRYTLRSWARSPAFAIVAILTLALGLAAATSIFSVVDSVLLRPLPYPHPERIVDVREIDEHARGMQVAEANFNDLRTRTRSFEGLARYGRDVQAVTGGNEPVRANVCAVSPDFFRVLGLQPIIGRPLSDQATDQGVVVSYGFWTKVLNARHDLDGVSLQFAQETFPVVGVLPEGTAFPFDVEVWCSASIYPPVPSRTAHNWEVIGRLRPGATLGQVNAEISQIGRQLKQEYGSDIDASGFKAAPVRERMVSDVRTVLLVLSGAVGLLLVIAASNVTSLVLVRATVRQREIALRVALGASRGRLFRQFLAEGLLLTFAGGIVGTLLAFWSVDLIVGLYHGNLPRFGVHSLSWPVLVISLGLWGLLGLILASVPFWSRALRRNREALPEPGRGYSPSKSEARMRGVLVMAQIALTLALLVGAGLLGRSFQRVLAIQPGFAPENAVAMIVSKPDPADTVAARELARFYTRLMERLAEIPGVTIVGAVESLPLTGGTANGTFIIEDGGKTVETIDELAKEIPVAIASGRSGDAIFHVASGSYFAAMRIPILRGRSFQDSDGPDNPHVALVTESLARRYFAGKDPIGKQIQFGNMDGDLHLLTIVGVVGDVKDRALDAEPHPTVYVNYAQRATRAGDFSFVLRGHGSVETLIGAMRREAGAADAQMPVKFQKIEQLISSSLDNRRFGLVLVGGFAAAALMLAMVGLYGIMAYITAERTTEVGIRMALGAQRSDVLRLILGQSFVMVLIGTVAGLLLACGTNRFLETLLYEVKPTDPSTYLGVLFLLGLVALVASYIPARRAMRVEPMAALRHE